MSFLNPITLPVKHYSSTDDGAPQIIYDSQHRAYLKNILKACLVTGYAQKQGAGWVMENEDEVNADFIAPDVSMHDSRLLLKTDTRDTQIACRAGALTSSNLDRALPHNGGSSYTGRGWDLLVSDRGFYFLDHVYQSHLKIVLSRLLYFGQVKSAISDNGINLALHSHGHIDHDAHLIFKAALRKILLLKEDQICVFSSAVAGSSLNQVESQIYLHDHIYLNNGRQVIAQQPGLIARTVNTREELSLNHDVIIDGKPYIFFTLAATYDLDHNTNFGLRLDAWDY